MSDKNKIDSEIDTLATRMAKSTVDPKKALFNTILEMGPEGLKKAAATLSEKETELLKSTLEEMKKAANMPGPADDSKKLTPATTKTPAKKMATESESGSDDEDEKLMENSNAEIKHQGGPKDSPIEGQVIKGREPGKEHVTASGAIIIGKTSTGKPMYANAEHPAHVDMDHKDHKEASDMHRKHAEDIRGQMDMSEKDEMGEPKDKAKHVEMYSQASNHEKQSMEHQKMSAKKEESYMKKCYGSSMAKSVRKEIRNERKLAKSLFNCAQSIAKMPEPSEMTKEQCMQEIHWKLQCLKDLKEESWLIESEVPEIKEMMEKKFSKIKSEIRALADKHSDLKKAYENFMTKASDKAKMKLAKKQGIPEGVDEAKWERGVKEVKEQGHDKTSAIKIINSTIKKSEQIEQREDAKIDGTGQMKEEAQNAQEKQANPSPEKLAKKEMKKAKKIKKSLQKIVKFAKALKMTKEETLKSIKDANNNLKLVKAELKAKLVKSEMDAAPQNPEQNQVKQASQDKKQEGMDENEEKINKEEGELKIEAPKTADQSLAELPKVEKSVNWNLKSSIAAGSLGRNTHYEVDAYIASNDAETKEIIKKGGYFGEAKVEELKKSDDKKVDLNDLIEKGMDYNPQEIQRIQANGAHKTNGIKLVKSFSDRELAIALGMDEKTYKELMGSDKE